MRIQEAEKYLNVKLEDLGFEPDDLEKFRNAIWKPWGMILVTGPTGSGKTTTLYSALMERNQPDVNIMTAEDPVEVAIPGINQVQVNERIGLTFSNVLRAFLRQDPDIILVGEIRDQETGDIHQSVSDGTSRLLHPPHQRCSHNRYKAHGHGDRTLPRGFLPGPCGSPEVDKEALSELQKALYQRKPSFASG